MITEVMETAAILKECSEKTVDSDNDSKSMYQSYKSQLQSISSKAAKNIAQFPIIMTYPNDSSDLGTTGIKRKDVVMDIAKFIECECARFLITAAGLSPIVDIKKQTLGEKLSSLTGYGYSLESADDYERRSIEEYYSQVCKDRDEYTLLPESKSLFSLEADINGVDNSNTASTVTTNSPYDFGRLGAGGLTTSGIGTTLNDKQPTVINIKFTFSNGGNFKEHTIPIIVKASPYFVEPEEMQQYIKDVSINSNKFAQLIRLRARDIKFWKDFVFDYENIKKYREMRDNIGRWPIAKRLKDDSFYKKFTAFMSIMPVVKKFVTGNTNTMPKASIVCSKNELASACTRKWRDIIKKPKEIYRVISSSMLLSFSVIDWESELVFTYFDGLDEPYVNSFKNLAASSNTRNGEIKMMTELIKFMQIQQRRI